MKKLELVAKNNDKLSSVLELINQFDKIQEHYKDVTKKQSEIDLELSNWYHIVEGAEIKHISESHKLIKLGKDILKRRRENKLELLIIRSTNDTLLTHINGLKARLDKTIDKNGKVNEEIKERAII